MDLETRSEQNLKTILDDLAKRLDVANQTLLDPKHYDINKYEELKMMHDMIVKKGTLTPMEIQAFIDELRSVRKI